MRNNLDASSGGGIKDPVCGMTVDPKTASYRTEHEGRTYCFCCEPRLEKFRADPKSYTKGEREE